MWRALSADNDGLCCVGADMWRALSADNDGLCCVGADMWRALLVDNVSLISTMSVTGWLQVIILTVFLSANHVCPVSGIVCRVSTLSDDRTMTDTVGRVRVINASATSACRRQQCTHISHRSVAGHHFYGILIFCLPTMLARVSGIDTVGWQNDDRHCWQGQGN